MFAYRRQGPGRRQETDVCSGLLESKKCPLQNRERLRTGLEVDIPCLRATGGVVVEGGRRANNLLSVKNVTPARLKHYRQVTASCHHRRLGESLAGRRLPSTHSSKSKVRSSARSSSTSSLRLGGDNWRNAKTQRRVRGTRGGARVQCCGHVGTCEHVS